MRKNAELVKDWWLLGLLGLTLSMVGTVLLMILTFPLGVVLSWALWPYGLFGWVTACGVTALGFVMDTAMDNYVGATDK